MKLERKEPQLFILLLLVCFASIAAVLFTPALPQIAKELNLSSAQAQLTMSIFLVGYALGSLPYGPFSNRFGRKPTVYLGISLAIIGCLLVLLDQKFHTFWLLVTGRLILALGSSVGIKIAFTMIGDFYQHEKATKKISYLMLALASGPGLAIALGGFLTHRFGWESTFYFLIIYSVILFLLSLLLPETCTEIDSDALQPSKIVQNYSKKFKNKTLVTCAMLMGCGTSMVYLFASEAPFIGITRIGLTPEEYGYFNFIPPLGLIVGSLYANLSAGKKHPLAIMQLGAFIALGAAACMLLLFLTGNINFWTLFIPMPFVYIGISLVTVNASSRAMSHAKNKSNASAVMNTVNIGTSAVALFIWELIPSHPTYLMPFFFILFVGVIFLLRIRLKAEMQQI